jgi:hypothetical protein
LIPVKIEEGYNDAHAKLAAALKAKGLLEEAGAEELEDRRHKSKFAIIHEGLGEDLLEQGKTDEAIAAYQEAIRLNKDHPEAHLNLGIALDAKGQFVEAAAAYRQAILIKKDWFEAHYNLAVILTKQGMFREAAKEFRLGYELNSKNPYWADLSARQARDCERFAELDGHLPAILSGQKRPADTDERLALAQLCQLPCKKRYVSAVRFSREAFAEKPQLAEDVNAGHRYDAAWSAALAGCGQGADADKLDSKERAGLRRQALDWLRADLKAYEQFMEKAADKNGPAIEQQMQLWLQDKDLAGVREAKSLASLPQAERKEWHKLWEEVETLRKRGAQERLRNAEIVADSRARLPALLAGKQKAKNADERITLARFCQTEKMLFAASARGYSEAFAEEPKLAEDLSAQHRYNAACAAALAGCGQGKDADKLAPKERAGLRQQALDWLRADLKAYGQVMEKSADKDGPAIAQLMQHWLQDEDFAGVRGDKALAKLPEAERKDWQKLWQEIEILRQRAGKQPKTASSARP